MAEGALLPLERGSAGAVLLSGDEVAESVEDREPGVASASVAVRDAAGRTVGAVSVSGPVERVTRRPRERYEAELRRAAAEISAALAG